MVIHVKSACYTSDTQVLLPILKEQSSVANHTSQPSASCHAASCHFRTTSYYFDSSSYYFDSSYYSKLPFDIITCYKRSCFSDVSTELLKKM